MPMTRDQKRPSWSIGGSLLVLIFGAFLALVSFSGWYETRRAIYRTPAFEDLNVSTGTIAYFTEYWKSSGGHLVLKAHGGVDLTLRCVGPYSETACFYLLPNGENRGAGYEKKTATARWQQTGDSEGRLFQLEIGKTSLIQYEERARAYELDYQHGRPGMLIMTIFASIFIVFPALLNIFRHYKQRQQAKEQC